MKENKSRSNGSRKRRHHYVWKKYLNAWAVGGKVWAIRRGEVEPFQTNPINLAVERDFYKVQMIDSQDFEPIKDIVGNLKSSVLFSLYDAHISVVQLLFSSIEDIFAVLDALLSCDHDDVRDFVSEMSGEIERMLLIFEEDVNELVENESIDYIELILQGDISFLDNDRDAAKFVHFLMVQRFRTKRMKEEMRNLRELDGWSPSLFEKAWHILRFVYAIQDADRLLNSDIDFSVQLLRCPAGMSFITGDQPVVENGLGYYYPVSPDLAICISGADQFKSGLEVAQHDVQGFNDLIRRASGEFLCARKREDLIEC